MGILDVVEKLRTATFDLEEERVAWEGLAASCAGPIRRFGAFVLVGFVFFVAATTAVVLFYNLFGTRLVEGAGVPVPQRAFYATMLLGVALAVGGYVVWLLKSLSSFRTFGRVLRRGGVDPEAPTRDGLRAYSDEQLLALRSRYERMQAGRLKDLLARLFGFHKDDSFSLGPLSALPGTFEMDSLRVEWETHLILRSDEPMPPVGWWTEGRHDLLPRKPDEVRKLLYTLRYTDASVRELKRRYGFRTERWHATVPEGKLFDAVRDLETSQRIQVALGRRSLIS